MIKFISPDDYDDAVRQDPISCPHIITGDHRCGRQLIADAATDVHVQLAGMVAAISGRMELNCIASFAESATPALGSRLDLEQQRKCLYWYLHWQLTGE